MNCNPRFLTAIIGACAFAWALGGADAALAQKKVHKPAFTKLPAMGGTFFKNKKFVTIDGQKFPALAPLPPPPIPKDNSQTVDKNGFPRMDDPKVQLGYKLFFDARLSGDSSVACSTCHNPEEGWGLNSAISRGYPGISHWRNSHTVINSAYQGKLFWDGHSLSLERQAPSAAQGLSGNGKPDMMEQRLRQIPGYVKAFKQVFGGHYNMVKDSWRAIAAFQRALVQPDTPLDKYLLGDKSALSEEQVRGKKLFEGKARCIMCHNGPLLSDEKNYNLGVPQNEAFLKDPIMQAGHRSQMYSRGVREPLFRKLKWDPGSYMSTKLMSDLAKFRTQPLRYLEFTPPYMHNGVFDDLEEVVDFYNDGGGANLAKRDFGIDNKTKVLKKLDLTDSEKEDLVEFMGALSGEEILLTPPVLPMTVVSVTAAELRSQPLVYVNLPK